MEQSWSLLPFWSGVAKHGRILDYYPEVSFFMMDQRGMFTVTGSVCPVLVPVRPDYFVCPIPGRLACRPFPE